jgi:hypothetical protein
MVLYAQISLWVIYPPATYAFNLNPKPQTRMPETETLNPEP